MEELVAALDPDVGREDWIKVGMALHHECDGDDTGFEIWNEWSACGGKYPSEEALRAQWDSFERRKGSARRQVTMASVIKMTKDLPVSADGLRRVAEEAASHASATTTGVTPPDYDGRFPLRRAGDIARLPAGKWWIKGILPKAQIGAIFGASGSGKSFLALDIMAHLSLGRSWRGSNHRSSLLRLDARNNRIHGNGRPLVHDDLDNRPSARRRDLGVHFVGGDLKDRLVALHLVAELLEPPGERAFGNRLTHLGHDHINTGHCSNLDQNLSSEFGASGALGRRMAERTNRGSETAPMAPPISI
jgi:hypothetical protein